MHSSPRLTRPAPRPADCRWILPLPPSMPPALAISNSTVFDLALAEPTLLAALTDQRPEIVKLAGNVLAYVNTMNGQAGLLTVGAEDKTADDVKISLFKSLSNNAKYFGNKLEPQQ